MKLLGKLFLCVLCAGLLGTQVAAKKGKQKASPTPDAKAPKFNPLIPVGHSAKGITLPYFNEAGKLQMRFKIGVANRIDIGHLQMSDVMVETFGDDGQPGMKIDLPISLLDLNTEIVTSDHPVTVERSDFTLVGEALEFDSRTRRAKFTGKVRMLIFDREELGSGEVSSK
ncbi:MAG: LPS export ABC transporter periplasmic protein LptC [Verrucomicrobiota bacterium]|nr:LPS export ABC transporter periplasmic protein LptC [Verrucomicrobiota bacterium]